jgi:DNA-binding Xre family transcriptional regulator
MEKMSSWSDGVPYPEPGGTRTIQCRNCGNVQEWDGDLSHITHCNRCKLAATVVVLRTADPDLAMEGVPPWDADDPFGGPDEAVAEQGDPEVPSVDGHGLAVLVGRRVKELRGGRRLDGFTPSQLSKLERGRASPTLSTLSKLATALGVTVEELVRGA